MMQQHNRDKPRLMNPTLLSCLVWVILSTLAGVAGGIEVDLVSETPVSEGVVLREYQLDREHPGVVRVLEMDRSDPTLALELGCSKNAMSQWWEPVSRIHQRYNNPLREVLAGTNASFAEPDGSVTGAVVASASWARDFNGFNRETFGWTLDGHCQVSAGLAFQGWVRLANGTVFDLTAINRAARDTELAAFTPQYGPRTPSRERGLDLVLSQVEYPFAPSRTIRGQVQELRTGGDTPLLADRLVISATGEMEELLRAHCHPGESVVLKAWLSPGRWGSLRTLLNGAGYIIKDGTAHLEAWERWGDGFKGYHPRTMLAYNDEFVWLVVADGRQPNYSMGLTFAEMAEFGAAVLGAAEMINLDGGGSSTMVVRGEVVNSPSDRVGDEPFSGSERNVINSLMIVRDQLPPPRKEVDIFGAHGRALAWMDRFTINEVLPFEPTSPGGDGYVLHIIDPSGGYETVRYGERNWRNYRVEAHFYCIYRPGLSRYGRDFLGLLARERGDGDFSVLEAGNTHGYGMVWQSDTGVMWVGCWHGSEFVSFVPEDAPLRSPTTGWKHFAIEGRDDQLTFFVDGTMVAQTTDTTHPMGRCALVFRSEFSDNSLAAGAYVDNFQFTPLVD